MQNTSEISHPGNKQNSLCPWEANTGGNPLMDKGHSREWQTGTYDLLKDTFIRKLTGPGVATGRMVLFESENNNNLKKKIKREVWLYQVGTAQPTALDQPLVCTSSKDQSL